MTFADLATYQQPAPTVGPRSVDVTAEVLRGLSRPGLPPDVLAAMRARQGLGRATYGIGLHTHDGRDALADVVTEALDERQYLVRLWVTVQPDRRWMVAECLDDNARILRRLLTLHNLRGPVTARHDGDGDAD